MLPRLFAWARQTGLFGAALAGGVVSAIPAPRATALPGREEDGRVAAIAFRLATHGLDRCSRRTGASGIVLQHLAQFERGDRAGLAAAWRLDRGPGVVALVADAPGERAELRDGDVLLAVDGTALPPQTGLDQPFSAAAALARADLVASRLAEVQPHALTVARGDATVTLTLRPVPACVSDVRLARSPQRNAFADGRHATITTGLLARLADVDQLAFVIAHEMAHNILGHAALMHGRVDTRPLERAADALGVRLMRDAGFDPLRGAAALGRGGGFHLLSAGTHDDARARVQAVRDLLAAPDASDPPPVVGGAMPRP